MATVQHTTDNLVGGTIRVTWANLATDDVGSPVAAPDHTFKEVQVGGTFGGSTCVIQGTLRPVADNDWETLNDVQGNPLSFTTDRIERIQESTATVRPSVTGGAAAAVDVTMILKPDVVLS